MNVNYLTRSGDIIISLKAEEYDILLMAITLLDWSATGNETDAKKLNLIDQMRRDMISINTERIYNEGFYLLRTGPMANDPS